MYIIIMLYGFRSHDCCSTTVKSPVNHVVRTHMKSYIWLLQVVDVPVDHPSCSSQHAVLQYRLVNYEKKDGSTGKQVRYIYVYTL